MFANYTYHRHHREIPNTNLEGHTFAFRNLKIIVVVLCQVRGAIIMQK